LGILENDPMTKIIDISEVTGTIRFSLKICAVGNARTSATRDKNIPTAPEVQNKLDISFLLILSFCMIAVPIPRSLRKSI
jgi:hypothetical protein